MKKITLFSMLCCLPIASFAIGPITGSTSMCLGTSGPTLADATSGGTWQSSNTAVAAIGLSSGDVTGISAGTAEIYYIVGADTASVEFRVINTPSAPTVTGAFQYCQYIGPFVPDTVVATTSSDTIRWYTVATGGLWSSAEPIPNINVAGLYNFWVSQEDSGCEGPRTPVTITGHPKPEPPVVTLQAYCKYATALPLDATPSTSGDFLTWYGPGISSGGTLLTPIPSTLIGPDTITYYVTETSVYGCVSDSTADPVIIVTYPCPSLGINNDPATNESNPEIYPNPTTGIIYVTNTGALTIKVYNLLGQLVKETSNIDHISIAEFPGGMYFIRLFNEQNEMIQQDKIIKQ